jgi:hypothetical protein
VQAAIADAVKSETAQILTHVPKFMGRQEQLRKAIHNGTVAVIDRTLLAGLFGGGADGLLRQLEAEGTGYIFASAVEKHIVMRQQQYWVCRSSRTI